MADEKLSSSVAELAIIAKSSSYECDQSILTRADGSAAFKQGEKENEKEFQQKYEKK